MSHLFEPGPSAPGEPGAPSARRVLGWPLKRLRKAVRHFMYDASEFKKLANTEHLLRVPQGKFWELIGGYLTRGVCTATLNVSVYTKDNVLRRRLVVLASGASDTTDIPDDVARIRQHEIIEEGAYILVAFGGAQNSDSLFNIDVLESETK